MNVAVQILSRLRPSILLCVEPTYILVSDLRRNYVAVLELSVPVTAYPVRSSSGTSQWLQRSIGSAAPCMPWETKVRGEPTCCRRGDESGRERQGVPDQVPVGVLHG